MLLARMRRWLLRILGLVAVLAAAVFTAGWLTLRASLPEVDGELALAGLRSSVTVARDDHGVPTLIATDRLDLARATGFVHAQDRFFQMDLLRRAAAGELAGLVGQIALPRDRQIAVEQLRDVARRALAESQPAIRALIAAYADGVNAGLDALGARPFEYWLLRSEPVPWQSEDSLLVALSMFLDLTDRTARKERDDAVLRHVLGEPAARFLAPAGGSWDAPLQGEALPPPDIPAPTEWVAPVGASQVAVVVEPGPVLGSNNWAVAGRLTTHGGAIVADDMHLGLSLPNIWYRMRLQLRDSLDITGVTLPGLPAVVAGSNGHVAWGFTNSYGDFSDIVLLDSGEIVDAELELTVPSGDGESLRFQTSRYGPVRHDPVLGDYAVQWTAREPGGLNLRLLLLEQARTLEEAMAVAHGAGMPPQNFVVAQADGRVGWTVAGRIPVRQGFDGTQPTARGAGIGWDGWLAADAIPRVIDPPSGRLWTANSRVVSGEALRLLGDGGYALGARAGQIRDGLHARDHLDEAAMHAIVLDDRALFLQRWRGLLINTLDTMPEGEEAERLVREQGRRASVDDAGYPLVRAFHREVSSRIWSALTAAVRDEAPGVSLRPSRQFEHALWELLEQRPAHLLPADVDSWSELLTSSARRIVDAAASRGPLAEQRWGEQNRVQIGHPLAAALPGWLRPWLQAPDAPQAGDRDMPRVAGPSFGASERFAVSPGREAQGYFTMPGGQSGHPLSPWFMKGHAAWAAGEPAPFLPGPTEHHLTLKP